MAAERLQLADVSRDVHFDEGTTIYEGGGPSAFLYFIVKGEVALEAPGEVAWAFHERDGFGFLDAMSERPHARTARAVTDAHVLAMHAEDSLDVLEDSFALGRAMIMTTCEAVREKVLTLAPDGAFPELAERNSTMSDPPNLVERLMVLRQEGVLERAGVQALATLAAHAKPVVSDHQDPRDSVREPRVGICISLRTAKLSSVMNSRN
ncbi:MAG: cyclic nucleotide-binding domain-containing protein [Polyangiaceae bacterium]|nr:cyclic nucleotide-binding domain-containing protein [Polyangiaceae bacterium]